MTDTPPTGSRYLEDLCAPIAVEYTERDLAVTGTLPLELDGRYLRNGETVTLVHHPLVDAPEFRPHRISFGPGRSCGEAGFVPRSADGAEDDGWYLTLVHDRATDLSELVVLDASAPDQGPVASVHLPTRVPLGFHGNWVPTGS